jgi:GxxExxY protein
MKHRLVEERLTESVIGAFYEVYRRLGYGLLEQLYAGALTYELRARGHVVEREVRVPVEYKGHPLGWQRLDLVVDDRVVVEIKASELLPPHARRQLLSYLVATPFEVGLLLHFGPKPHFCRLVDSRIPD